MASTLESLIKRAGRLAKPRPFGSAGEAKTRKALSEALRRAGWSVTEEPFSARFTIDAIAPLGIATSSFLLVLATVLLTESPLLAGISAVLALALSAALDKVAEIVLGLGIETGFEGSLGIQSANLRATHPALCRAEDSLWISAHLDAKRQSLPLLIRCSAAVLAKCSGVVSATAALGFLLAPSSGLLFLQRASFILAALGAITLLINSSDGATDGAVDNAGSLSVLLEIAERLNADPQIAANLNVELVATGGEEAGCLGAMALASQAAGRTLIPRVLNLEAMGAGPRLVLIAPPLRSKARGKRPTLAETIRGLASEGDFRLMRLPLAPGFWADHRPFLRAGLEAVTLCGFGKGIATIHTRLDRAGRLDGEALSQQAELTLAVAARLGEAKNKLAILPNM